MATPETSTLFDRLAAGFTPKGLDAIRANPPAKITYRADPVFPGLQATFYPTGGIIFSWKASDRRTVPCGKYRVTATLAEDDGCRSLARDMFARALPHARQLGPRGTAQAALGLVSLLVAAPGARIAFGRRANRRNGARDPADLEPLR